MGSEMCIRDSHHTLPHNPFPNPHKAAMMMAGTARQVLMAVAAAKGMEKLATQETAGASLLSNKINHKATKAPAAGTTSSSMLTMSLI